MLCKVTKFFLIYTQTNKKFFKKKDAIKKLLVIKKLYLCKMNNYRMKIKRILFHTLMMALGFVLFCNCKSMQELKNLQKCEFEFINVSDFEYAGVQFNNIRSINDITPKNVNQIIAATASKTTKISFTINVKVSNQSDSWATVNGMKWILYRNGSKLLGGDLSTPFSIEPHCSGIIMLRSSITPSLRGKTAPLQQIFKYYQNIIGLNDGELPNLNLKIKPVVDKTVLPYITLKLN